MLVHSIYTYAQLVTLATPVLPVWRTTAILMIWSGQAWAHHTLYNMTRSFDTTLPVLKTTRLPCPLSSLGFHTQIAPPWNQQVSDILSVYNTTLPRQSDTLLNAPS